MRKNYAIQGNPASYDLHSVCRMLVLVYKAMLQKENDVLFLYRIYKLIHTIILMRFFTKHKDYTRLLKQTTSFFFFLAIIIGSANAQDSTSRIYKTNKIKVAPPNIDGLFDDQAWESVEWQGGFIQREPYDGAKPTQNTRFKVLYDDNNVYVAIQALDSVPEDIDKRMTRRDEFSGDWVAIAFDSYFDKLTAFSFGVNAAGVKNDVIITNDNEDDDTWDPVWYVKTAVDSEGWNAEMRIPLTQLRFAKKEAHVWGLQVMRWLFRKEEFTAWQHIPNETTRWVSKFGELQGIQDIKPKKEVELIPYIMGNTERFEKEDGNPFATGESYGYSAGIDGKIAVTNDLTLNFTVNPDFGQVEADPSEVNLTAFETFFDEKRPFFIEGSNIYNYNLTLGDGGLSQDNLFYSRRIGRRPQYTSDLEDNLHDNECLDAPEFTRILGAFKLSGKTQNGWSVGVMESATAKEMATIDQEGERREKTVEPFTNFTNARLQKDINKGNSTIGGMITTTNRKIDDPDLDFLPHSAYTGGLDFTHFWKEKTYFVMGKTVFSQVQGSTTAITELQESSTRYFQRPDASHLSVDTSLLSLGGNGGSLTGGKLGGGHWNYILDASWRSPGLELNDQGYLRQADIVQQIFWVQYRIWEPFSIFRSLNVNFNQWSGFDYSGLRQFFGTNMNLNLQFKNYWSFGTGIDRGIENINRTELRGGPALLFPGDWNHWISLSSDARKKLKIGFNMFNNWGDISHSRFFSAGMSFTYRPIDALSISLSPSYTKGRRDLQYVDTYDFENNQRYIISTLNSKNLNADIRINYNLTPDLTFQYWGQPFVFSGNYSNFKRVTNSMSEDYNSRFHIFDNNEISYDELNEIYNVDENQDGNIDYSIDNPNFNFFEFRSNLVIRWEYVPGSTLFVVWSQGRTGDNNIGEFNFRKDMDALYSIVPHNVFLVKFSYRISL